MQILVAPNSPKFTYVRPQSIIYILGALRGKKRFLNSSRHPRDHDWELTHEGPRRNKNKNKRAQPQ